MAVIVASAVLVLSRVQTDTQTDADERFTPATLVGVSKEQGVSAKKQNPSVGYVDVVTTAML